MSQQVIEELRMGQQLLREEVRQLRTQLDLVMQLLTRREGSFPPYFQQTYPMPQIRPPQIMSPQPVQQGQHQQQFLSRPQNQKTRKREKPPPRRFDPIPMPYSQLLQHLLRGAIVEPQPFIPPPHRYPSSYDESARCEYHSNSPGHTVENCRALKHRIQDLIDNKQLTFEEGIPLINGQALP